MKRFHGTYKKYASALLNGQIDCTKGGGELGQGFYTGDALHLVAAWAYKRAKENLCIIEFDIDDNLFSESLRNLVLLKQDAIAINKTDLGYTRGSFDQDYDVVTAPVVGKSFKFYNQTKFNTGNGENFINSQPSRQIL